jgi:predicted metal-dependent HD superfamily phosphohydrolase
MTEFLPPALIADLRRRYAEPQRHYHTWAHIEALLGLYAEVQPMLADAAAFEAALYYHDAIYNPRRGDNEAQSAALLRQACAAVLSRPSLDLAGSLVEATAGHQPPPGLDAARRIDAALFLDIDLSILAAPEPEFAVYEAAIRREYAFVPEADYRRGRTAVLANFLKRESLFLSAHFYPRFEAAARRNLERSLAALG